MKPECSRREFLSAGVSTAVFATDGLATSSMVVAGASAGGPLFESGVGGLREQSGFDRAGSPSRGAYRALAEAERKHQLQMGAAPAQQGSGGGNQTDGSPTSPSFSQTVNAVEDLGADPSGGRPISQDIGSGMSDGTLIVFPPGQYLVDGDLQASVSDGTFGMVGAGYQQKNGPPSGQQAATFVASEGTQARINFDARSGLFANFVLDQRNTGSGISIVSNSSGFSYTRDIQVVGVTDSTGSGANEAVNNPLCALIADDGATVRVERFVARGTGYPGDKNVGGVPALWVGDANQGTAQIVDCHIEASADNGIYGSRTPGDTHIVGGSYINNEVAQVRYCGQGSFADGVTLVIDANNYRGPTGNSGGFNEQIGVEAVKIEQPSHINKPGGAVLRNADVRGLSANNMGGLVFVRGHGGALQIDNCRFANQVAGAPSVYAEAPGSSYDPASRPPHNISIANSLFSGPAGLDRVVDIQGRPNSLVTKTCFQIPEATVGLLSGISVGSGVGFGENCSSGGLRAPDAVGSGGNLSAVNFSAGIPLYQQERSQRSGLIQAAVTVVFMVLVVVASFIFGMLALSALFAALGSVIAYLVVDD